MALVLGLFQGTVHFPHPGRNQTFLSQEEGTGDIGHLLLDLCVALQGSDEQRWRRAQGRSKNTVNFSGCELLGHLG